MNKYESVFILKPSLTEEDVKTTLDAVEALIKEKEGENTSVNPWGRKRLGYQIKKFDEGLYFQIDFDMAPAGAKSIEKKLHLNENILRFLIVKKEQEKAR